MNVKHRVRTLRFGIKSLLVFTAAFALALWWWLPAAHNVGRAPIVFSHWEPSVADVRLTTKEELWARLGYTVSQADDLDDLIDWPDFSTNDVVPIPLNGLPGQQAADLRMKELATPVTCQFHNTPLIEVVDSIQDQFKIECEFNSWAIADCVLVGSLYTASEFTNANGRNACLCYVV